MCVNIKLMVIIFIRYSSFGLGTVSASAPSTSEFTFLMPNKAELQYGLSTSHKPRKCHPSLISSCPSCLVLESGYRMFSEAGKVL